MGAAHAFRRVRLSRYEVSHRQHDTAAMSDLGAEPPATPACKRQLSRQELSQASLLLEFPSSHSSPDCWKPSPQVAD